MLTTETPPPRAAGWIAWLLAATLGLGSLWLPLPAGLGLAPWVAGLLFAAAAFALGHAPERRLGPTLLRRLPIAAVWLALSMLAIAAVCVWPAWQLRQAPSLLAVLALSVALALAWIGLWRLWPLLALSFVDQPRRRGILALLAHCPREARRLVAADPSTSRGLLAALAALLLLVGVLVLPGLALSWPLPWRLGAGLGWYGLLAPFLAFLVVALVEPARLAAGADALPPPVESSRERPLAASSEGAVEATTKPLPTLLPGDPTARLLAATRIGRIDDALAALEAGADVQTLPAPEDRDQRSLAMLASILPDTRLLRRLIAAGVDVNRRHAGLTPLLAATRDSLRGRPEAVMTLLANGADPRAADGEGRTPLHFAALSSEPDVAALLLDAGAQIDGLNRDGYSALGVACAAGNWRMARFLLERKAKPEPAGGQPALLAAAAGEDDPAGVTLLLRFKAKVDAPGRLGRRALINAALAGNAAIVEALLDAGADPALADDHGVTALLEAARAGANAVIRQLPAAKAGITAVDSAGRNALVMACQSPRADAETVRLLLDLGVDAEQAANDGRRARDCALSQGRWPLLRELDPDCPLPSAHGETSVDSLSLEAAVAEDRRPWPARLDEALSEQDLDRVDLILREVGEEPDAIADFALRQAPGLSRAALQRLAAALPLPWLDAQPVLARAFRSGACAWVAALRERGASAGGLRLADWQWLQRGREADRSAEAVAVELLAAGADGSADCAGHSSLGLAVQQHWLALAEALLRRGADPNRRDPAGLTPLHHAARTGDSHALALLLRFGADPARRDREGCSALGLALRHGHDELRDWLDWRDWPLPGRALRDADLVAAASLGDAAALQRLLALGLNIEARDTQGATALMRASGGGHLAAVRVLIERGADLHAAASSGATSLTAAISMRHRDVVEALLDAGAPIDQALPGGVTPLMVAAALGLADMIRLLLQRGADPGRSDEAGNQAVHALAQFGFTARDKARSLACWQALLDGRPGLADAAGAETLTPLLLLLGARAEPGHPVDEECLQAQLERLLEAPIDLQRRDSRGFTALHLCALHGQLGALRRLLRAGADREARDALNRRPQELALMRGLVDLAAELEPLSDAPATPSLAKLLRRPGE